MKIKDPDPGMALVLLIGVIVIGLFIAALLAPANSAGWFHPY